MTNINRRILAHYILDNGIFKLSILDLTKEPREITLYREESSSTEFINGVVIVGNIKIKNYLTQLEEIGYEDISVLHKFLIDNNLYADNRDAFEIINIQ